MSTPVDTPKALWMIELEEGDVILISGKYSFFGQDDTEFAGMANPSTTITKSLFNMTHR